MNQISGRVLVKETGAGISDVIVNKNALPKGMELPDEVIEIDPTQLGPDIWKKLPGKRIGSISTDPNGRFALQYEDSDVQPLGKEVSPERPDLALFVVAPADPTFKSSARILFVSPSVITNLLPGVLTFVPQNHATRVFV
jgi:hypothetical protein